MTKVNYLVTGFVGGVIGTLLIVGKNLGALEYITAFVLAFSLTLILRDFYLDLRQKIRADRDTYSISEETV
ncbi:MAG: hypothetical protein H8E46_04010 [FCB group bacterium]|nr:hypothetical protein [FCB group bacterium]